MIQVAFSVIVKGLKQRGIQTLLLLSLYILFAQFLPLTLHQLFYTFSMLIKDILLWVMPVVVSFFIAHALQSFERRAPLFIIVLLIFEGLSNLSGVWYAFFSASSVVNLLPTLEPMSLESDFQALWRIPFARPYWWSADKGAMLGVVIGWISAFSTNASLKQFITKGKEGMALTLTRVFSRLIPLYILGFVAQMDQTNMLSHVFSHYSVIVLWLVLFLAIYLVFLFVVGAGGSISRTIMNMKSLLPAGSIAFTSGCSLSTMPWTIEGAAKTLQQPEFAKALIPATTNIQQIGDCITNAFLCFLIYQNFYGVTPDLWTWVQFSAVFTLARFATAGFQGGAIFVMLPIYEAYLNFNGEMIALILALNVILDPFVTSSNVLANGALCRTFERIWRRIQTLVEELRPGEVKL